MKKLLRLVVILGILGGLGWGATRIKWVSRETWIFEDQAKVEAEQERKKDEEITEKIRQITADDKGEYAVEVYRLGDESSYGFNQEEVMPARSVIKVPILAAVLEEGPVSATVGSLLARMGKKSDNNAQLAVEKKAGEQKIIKTIADLGMINTDYAENTTTAVDVTAMWKNLYQKPYWEELKGYLADSIFEDRIAVGIPEGTALVHKVGTDIDVWNDSGIIFPEIQNSKSEDPNNNQIINSKPYILVILNRDVDLEEAKKTVPEITKMVWDYERGKI